MSNATFEKRNLANHRALVTGLDDGIYHYDALAHELEHVRRGPPPPGWARRGDAAVGSTG